MSRIFLIFLLTLIFANEAWASVTSDVKQANKAFHDQQFHRAQKLYEEALDADPQSPLLNYNAATAYYKKGEFVKAVDHLHKSLLTEDEQLKQRAYYNLGNSLYKQGVSLEDENMEDAIASVESAIKEYEKSMALDQQDVDAKHNYAFVKKELVRLKEKQQQMQEQNKNCPLNNDKQKDDQKNNDQKKNQNQKNEQNQQDQQQQGDQQQQKQEQNQQNQQGQQQDQQQQQQSSQENQPGEDQERQDQQPQQGQQQDQQDAQQQENQQDQQNQTSDSEAAQQQGQKRQMKGQLSEREAKMLLQNYEQNQEPKEMLLLKTHQFQFESVEKDW